MVDLVKNVVRVRFSDLPAEAIETVKKCFLDTLGVAIAGSSAEGSREVVDLVKEYGGTEESTIWVYGGKVPAGLAGLANGPMARARDLGDVHEGGSYHQDETIIPAALPIAERLGKVTGQAFITAVALGQDLMARIGLCVNQGRVTPRGTTFRVFGPTATVGKLLSFNEELMLNAMGIAYSHTFVEKQGYKDGALTPRLQHGFVADGAIRSCLLAEKGLAGTKNILQGEFGYFATFEEARNIEALTSELGKRFEGIGVSLKPYASCKFTHTAIGGTIGLVKKHSIKPQDVVEISVGVSPRAYGFVCQPEEVKSDPRNTIDAQFSLYYTVAVALIKGDVFIEDFTEAALLRNDVRELMKRVKPRIEATLVRPEFGFAALVTIRTKGGKEYTESVPYIRGHPKNPMTMAEVADKFRRCLPFSAKPFPERNAELIINMVSNLEEVSDVGEIARLLAP